MKVELVRATIDQKSIMANLLELYAYDFTEFFVMKKYKQHGIGTAAALKIWEQFKGQWQVRVLVDNKIACSFWLQAIKKFTSVTPSKKDATINGEDWIIYSFESKGI